MADVTIIVPTYFGGQLLYNCLEGLSKSTSNPKILVYKNDIGWLKACNEAMMSVPNDDVILLNDDTFVLTDIIAEMRKVAYMSDDIGIVGGKALSPANPDTIINYGIYVGVDGNTAHKHFGRPRDSVDLEKQTAVEGSCMYIKRTLLNEVGYFDERYTYGYRAEVDYCFRARENNWKIISSPSAEYIHYVSQTSSQLNIQNDTYEIFMDQWGKKLKLGVV
jgi:GT2 family glycosyltransferase